MHPIPRILTCLTLACLPLTVTFADPAATSAMLRQSVGYRVECLHGEAAESALLDEAASPWFSLHSPEEYAALTRTPVTPGLDAPAASRKTFAAGRRDFTPEETAALHTACARVRRLGGKPFAALTERPWCFLKLRRGLAGDFPHTRGGCIIFTEAVLPGLTEYEKRLAGAPAEKRPDLETAWMRQVGELFLHEQLHVVQRARPAAFTALYAHWGFERIKPVPPPADPATFAITNPDAPLTDVAWRDATGTRRIFGMRLRHRTPFALMDQDLVLLSWKLESAASGRGAAGPAEPAAQVPGFAQKFPVPETGCDHPNEISAYLLGAVLQAHLNGEPAPAGAARELADHLAAMQP